jgi:transketolase
MKPPIRLAALMELPVIYLFTHDSIGVGEDGPTHQPVEQLLALRTIPGLITLRPADANEVVEAWRVIIGLRHQPACMALSRQALPTLDRTRYAPAAGARRGAYILADPLDSNPAVVLIGTGSEVALCIETFEELKREGIPARVVSMPSWTGARIGMATFGSSAPLKDVLSKYGFTPAKVVAAAKEQIAKFKGTA